MMLPVIGVETREVMRTKVVQVMQEASTRLKDYESIRRVIRIAVDDAGLLSIDDGQTVVRGHRTRLDGTMQQTTRRAQFKDQEDMNDVDGNLSGDDKANGDDDVDDESDVDANNDDKGSVWFRRAGSRSPSTVPNPRKNRLTDAASIDDTQIPIVAEVAMEAVLDYVSEILSPTLVIHQLTEGIQSALQQISKAKALQSTKDGISTDEGNDTDLDINTLSSQSASMSDSDHHGLDLLSDDWVGNGIEEKEEEGEEDLKGQDEDLWDRDMETHDWDSTGHLFEDLEGGIEEGNSLQQPKALTSGADNEDEQEEDADYEGSVSPFSIGIQEEDGDQQQQEQGDDDDMTDEDEGKGSLWAGYTAQRRFHKRRLLEEDDERSSQEEVDVRVQAAAATSNSKAAPLLRKRNEPALLSRRRPDFAPDPRLETLLAQLIEPVLITFIDEDLPASCRRVQGELMDGIIWSLDQSQRMKNANSVQDRLALLAELEY
ncbi:hypothetical protein EDD11_002579 [Mortierella claussenii]|nr:hypothetical protein EDD11_002579 [Mortierella claussenii]